MNAVIALCHFCESHGPSILFCTQAFHCTNHNPEDVLSGAQASLAACGNFNHSSLFGLGQREKPLEDEPFREQEEGSKTPKKTFNNCTANGPRQSTCVACTSLQQGEPGLVSIDRESHISYISRQYPEDQELYSIVRHACVRSLSCEVCPGREGPIMFGDEASGYVFSHTFFLKDSQSRGFQRWYSVICVMMDRVYLVNSWPFLITNFKNIIDNLQSKADSTFKEEKAENPLADQRLHMSTNLFLLNANQFIRTRGGNTNYRSLHDLVRDKNIFHYLHQYFAWILKASGQRYSEQFVEGPPVEDFSNIEEDESDLKVEETGPAFQSLRQLSRILSPEIFEQIAYHVVIGDQLVVRSQFTRTISSCLNLLKELIPPGCYRCKRYSNEYQDSWKCNFLGLGENTEIPAHVFSSNLYVLLDVKPTQNNEVRLEEQENEEEILKSLSFSVQGSPVGCCPSYLKTILQAMHDKDFADSVFSLMLSTVKDEWMNKVKVMFKFSKTGSRTTVEKVKLLQVLNARPEDEILLKFWMTSLSRPYRAHLLTCTSQKSVERSGAKRQVSNEQLFFSIP